MTLSTIKKEYRNFGDLYGHEVLITMLKATFKNVCYTSKAIPSAGSPVKDAHFVREDLIVKKAIFHRNNEVTILTNNGNLRFF